MATSTKNSTEASAPITVETFLAVGRRVQVNLMPEAWQAGARDRISIGTIAAVNASGILLTGEERHPNQPQGLSYIPWSSIATIDEIEQIAPTAEDAAEESEQ